MLGRGVHPGLVESRIAREVNRSVAAAAEREPRLQRDVGLLKERPELGLQEVGVALGMDECGLDLALVEKAAELRNGEVRNADCVNLARLMGLLEVTLAGLNVPGVPV